MPCEVLGLKLAGQKRVLLDLLLAWFWVICPLNSPASGEDVIASKPGGLPAAGEHGDLTELARHLNNPVGPVWNIVTQNNWYLQKGFPSTTYRVQYVLNFQPVVPALVTKPILE